MNGEYIEEATEERDLGDIIQKYLTLKKVKALFIYIVDRKASAYSCRFFCSACFQLRSTTTGTLLLIQCY